jgi:hypothetical protein
VNEFPSPGFGAILHAMLAPSTADGPPFVHDLTPRRCEPCAAAEAPECRDGVLYCDGGEANDYEDVYVGPCGCDCHKPQPSYTLEWARPEQSPPAPALSRRQADRWARRIAKLFDVPPWITGASPPPLAIDGRAYRQRQRNRVKRGRR